MSVLPLLWPVGERCAATEIHWFSAANQTNLTGGGAAMDSGFRFELGVFANGFVPTQANVADWVANWRPATDSGGQTARAVYHSGFRRYEGVFTVESNAAPFTVGATAYVWGFRGEVGPSEWVLFRHTAWTWPTASSGGPPGFPLEWEAKDASAVLGTIHSSGSPFLIQSAAVTLVSPPTTWEQWKAEELSGEAQNGPDDDPDGDGISNLLEYVFGLRPKQTGPPPNTPVALVDGYLRLTVPRRADHPSAVLAVEVSQDLVNWYSGAGHTVVVSDTATALVVRDATAAATPGKRFMRLRVTLP
ncbi:MAG: hypothetical protein J0M04_11890 [Verrucomicrobia bacterium]|nr:hypothetical protein [Verrucomicrobiota bacterium]